MPFGSSDVFKALFHVQQKDRRFSRQRHGDVVAGCGETAVKVVLGFVLGVDPFGFGHGEVFFVEPVEDIGAVDQVEFSVISGHAQGCTRRLENFLMFD